MFGVLKRLAGCPVPPEIQEWLRRQAIAEAERQEAALWERIDRRAEAVMAELVAKDGWNIYGSEGIVAAEAYSIAEAMEAERAKRRGAK
jgi:hypothetical protein